MSRIRTKITFQCECGKYYDGSCDHQSALLMEYDCSSDRFDIVYKEHVDDPETKPKYVIGGGDNMLAALHKLVSGPDDQLERWNDSDFDVLKAGRGW